MTTQHQQPVQRGKKVRLRLALAALVVGSAALVSVPAGAASANSGPIVVPRGQPVQIAIALDRSTPIGAIYTPSIRNAIQMALQLHPAVRGFRIQLNDYDAPCGAADDVVALNSTAAAQVVANEQNVAVVGHMCSYPFGEISDPCPTSVPAGTALAIYESNEIPTINGSTTSPCLSADGPSVFNATAVPDASFDAWYAEVQTLPVDRLWRLLYRLEFGAAPSDFADLYFDATNLLLTRLTQASTVVHGSLVVDRSALAAAIRTTTGFPGVTCTVSLDPTTGFRIDDPAALARCGG